MPWKAKIEPQVERFGIWATAIAAVWGVMTWLASHLTPLAEYGWAAFVFIGLGIACILSLVVSAGLVTWRYFRPLKAKVDAPDFSQRQLRLKFAYQEPGFRFEAPDGRKYYRFQIENSGAMLESPIFQLMKISRLENGRWRELNGGNQVTLSSVDFSRLGKSNFVGILANTERPGSNKINPGGRFRIHTDDVTANFDGFLDLGYYEFFMEITAARGLERPQHATFNLAWFGDWSTMAWSPVNKTGANQIAVTVGDSSQ